MGFSAMEGSRASRDIIGGEGGQEGRAGVQAGSAVRGQGGSVEESTQGQDRVRVGQAGVRAEGR